MTQEQRILEYLQDFGSITSWEAIKEFGVTRLSAIVFNLRKRGYNIETSFETAKNRYGDKVSYGVYKLNIMKERQNDSRS